MFIPPKDRVHRISTAAHCGWCATRNARKEMFKLRDGPLDHYFCNELHAEAWLEYRHVEETYKVCKLPPKQKIEYLQGKSMDNLILELFPDRCEHSQ